MNNNKPGTNGTTFNIILKEKHFKNDPILVDHDLKILIDEFCNKINNDPYLERWKKIGSIVGWGGVKATPKYLKDNDKEN